MLISLYIGFTNNLTAIDISNLRFPCFSVFLCVFVGIEVIQTRQVQIVLKWKTYKNASSAINKLMFYET